MNKSPIKRICEITGLHTKVVYGKLDFIQRQCMAFAGKWQRAFRVFMDQDSGIRAAFLSAFVDCIKARTADGWFVSILKETFIHDKERAVCEGKRYLNKAAAAYPTLTRHQLLELLMKASLAAGIKMG